MYIISDMYKKSFHLWKYCEGVDEDDSQKQKEHSACDMIYYHFKNIMKMDKNRDMEHLLNNRR